MIHEGDEFVLRAVANIREAIAACDDNSLLRNDAFASIIVPEDGVYRILIHEAAIQGSESCQYRLHIDAPAPTPQTESKPSPEKPADPQAKTEKPLSRLEQLRQKAK